MQGLFGSLHFVNEKLLGKSKQDTVDKAGVFTILAAKIRHDLRFSRKIPLRLEYPNAILEFPLPNRWSNPDKDVSKQQLYMVFKQVSINVKKAGLEERFQIDQDPDRSRGNINVMNFFSTIRLDEIENIHMI
jgi:hypothetical protein